MSRCNLFCCSTSACANRPYRFICYDQSIILGINTLKLRYQILHYGTISLLSDLDWLTYAIDDFKALLLKKRELFSHALLILLEDGSALTVPYQNSIYAKLLKLLQSYLACIGSILSRIGILCPDSQPVIILIKCSRRRKYNNSIITIFTIQSLKQLIDIPFGTCSCVIHFEVCCVYHSLSNASIPGNFSPSISFRLAPPPVLTKLISSTSPALCATSAVSPPPTIVVA